METRKKVRESKENSKFLFYFTLSVILGTPVLMFITDLAINLYSISNVMKAVSFIGLIFIIAFLIYFYTEFKNKKANSVFHLIVGSILFITFLSGTFNL